jgi:hypothetical protein
VLRECDRKFCDQVSPFSESIFGFNQFYDSAASELSKWVREYSNVSSASRCLPRVPILQLLVIAPMKIQKNQGDNCSSTGDSGKDRAVGAAAQYIKNCTRCCSKLKYHFIERRKVPPRQLGPTMHSTPLPLTQLPCPCHARHWTGEVCSVWPHVCAGTGFHICAGTWLHICAGTWLHICARTAVWRTISKMSGGALSTGITPEVLEHAKARQCLCVARAGAGLNVVV